ncbi:hypothetical protein DdX_00138 [Ditylenchus destructor]|uniref:Uncharacterized protein n=1 Tax=Ditylenchus destructor TaxID=166010 RepID=A0AAD4NK09_9BILA|nr:hypothetical protein DdX_00138 [Ditylenchus destructor]
MRYIECGCCPNGWDCAITQEHFIGAIVFILFVLVVFALLLTPLPATIRRLCNRGYQKSPAHETCPSYGRLESEKPKGMKRHQYSIDNSINIKRENGQNIYSDTPYDDRSQSSRTFSSDDIPFTKNQKRNDSGISSFYLINEHDDLKIMTSTPIKA